MGTPSKASPRRTKNSPTRSSLSSSTSSCLGKGEETEACFDGKPEQDAALQSCPLTEVQDVVDARLTNQKEQEASSTTAAVWNPENYCVTPDRQDKKAALRALEHFPQAANPN